MVYVKLQEGKAGSKAIGKGFGYFQENTDDNVFTLQRHKINSHMRSHSESISIQFCSI